MKVKSKGSKTAKKRLVKLTAEGKPVRRRILAQHLVRKKSKRSSQKSGRKQEFAKSEVARIKKIIS